MRLKWAIKWRWDSSALVGQPTCLVCVFLFVAERGLYAGRFVGGGVLLISLADLALSVFASSSLLVQQRR